MTSSKSYWPALLGASASVMVAGAAQGQVWRVHEPHVLGASLDMAIVADHPGSALAAARAARAEIDRLDAVLSRWRTDSELTAFNTGQGVAPSPDLLAVIQAAEHWRRATNGAFDAQLGLTDGALDLDGVGKGHVIDAALAAARRAAPDLAGMMIDIGGDLRVWGQAPSAQGWRVGVADPRRLADNAEPLQALWLNDKAVAFSGPGLRGDHILDPRTGNPARGVSAAVVASTARDADALATALCVMSPADGLALTDRLDGFEALLIDENGRRLPSRGWNALTAQDPPARLIRAQNPQGPAWPSGFSVNVNYEVPVIPRDRAQPPYIAFWITDQTGAPIRTLAILGTDLRFIDQNFIWWRRVGRTLGSVDTIARPTRRPGHYNIAWDGRDDKGQMLGQGRYTLHIEATREHGGHSYQTFDMSLGPGALTATAAADEELGATTVRYGPRAGGGA